MAVKSQTNSERWLTIGDSPDFDGKIFEELKFTFKVDSRKLLKGERHGNDL